MRSFPYQKGHQSRRLFEDATRAAAFVREIYETNTGYIRAAFAEFTRGNAPRQRVSAHYPYAAMTTERTEPVDSRLSYGFVRGDGTYRISLTRPDIFDHYYRDQFELLLRNHKCPVEIGVSDERIPLHFAYPEGVYLEDGLAPDQMESVRHCFDTPSLADMNDDIINGVAHEFPDGSRPLGLFRAARVDYSLHRMRHYTGTAPGDFQNFVIFTNYAFYVDEFLRVGHEMMTATDDPELAAARRQYAALIEPGGYTTPNANRGPATPTGTRTGRRPQMPAYHLTRDDGCGITLVNIGIGPSNAKNISDHVAVLRPHAWIMLGHCAGLRESQRIGDYVLAHAYVRDDRILDRDLPQWVPVPALAEVQKAIEEAVARVTGVTGAYDIKSVMRTGTVVTTDNRNWEISGHTRLVERFNKSRAIALDMESATIAANGFRFRVPYGTLLCVSDKPLHGEIKLPASASRFYASRIGQHLKIGMLAMEILREQGLETLHSRKLRSFAESAFQ